MLLNSQPKTNIVFLRIPNAMCSLHPSVTVPVSTDVETWLACFFLSLGPLYPFRVADKAEGIFFRRLGICRAVVRRGPRGFAKVTSGTLTWCNAGTGSAGESEMEGGIASTDSSKVNGVLSGLLRGCHALYCSLQRNEAGGTSSKSKARDLLPKKTMDASRSATNPLSPITHDSEIPTITRPAQ